MFVILMLRWHFKDFWLLVPLGCHQLKPNSYSERWDDGIEILHIGMVMVALACDDVGIIRTIIMILMRIIDHAVESSY